MKSAIYLSLILFSTPLLAENQTFELHDGDLLFQDLNCGKFCDSVDSVTFGYNKSYVSHVALVIDNSESHPLVIEAISKGVTITPLNQFLARSMDKDGNPRVMVGRLNKSYQPLIESAINFSRRQVGKPYNDSFIAANNNSFYCSELIQNAFTYANNQNAIFHFNKMDFTDGKSGEILPLWKQYYNNLNIPVPQGYLGTNPGMMSRESFITIIYNYGKLRIHYSN